MALDDQRFEARQGPGMRPEGAAEFLFQLLDEAPAFFGAQLIAEKEPQRRIVALSEDLFGKLGGIELDAVLVEQSHPFVEMERVAVHQDAVHVKNEPGKLVDHSGHPFEPLPIKL